VANFNTRKRPDERPWLKRGVSTTWPMRAPELPEYEAAHPWEERPWTAEDEDALEEWEIRRRERLAEANEY